MAATTKVKLQVQCEGLGPGVVEINKMFTDADTPDDFRRFDTMISTTATLLSTILNVPSAEIMGLALVARDGDVYINTISTTVSTAGGCVEDGECNVFTYLASNSCKITVQGGDADTAMSGLFWAAAV